MSKKVYCSRCIFVEGSKSKLQGGVAKIECGCPKNKKEVTENSNLSWYEEPKVKVVYDKKPSEINKSNNCEWFENKKK